MYNLQCAGPRSNGNDRCAIIAVHGFDLKDMAEGGTAHKVGVELKFPPEISGLSLGLLFGAAATLDFHPYAIKVDTAVIVIVDMTMEDKHIFSQLCISG